MMLRREFANAVGYLNTIFPEENQVRFIHWDFHKFAKRYACIHYILAITLLLQATIPQFQASANFFHIFAYFIASLPMF